MMIKVKEVKGCFPIVGFALLGFQLTILWDRGLVIDGRFPKIL